MTKLEFRDYIFTDFDWLKELFKEFCDYLQVYISFDTIAGVLIELYEWETYLDWYSNCDFNYKHEYLYVRSWVVSILEDIGAEFISNLPLYKC